MRNEIIEDARVPHWSMVKDQFKDNKFFIVFTLKDASRYATKIEA